VKVLAVSTLAALSLSQASVGVVGSAMRFAWPVGAAATVETEYVREQGEPGREVSRVVMSHRMRVLEHPEGRRIRYDQQRAISAVGDFAPAAAALLPFWIPSTIVRADGTFSRIEDDQRAQELFLAAIGPHLRVAEQIPALKQYVAAMTSAGATARLQDGDWHKLVRQWVGMPSSMEPMEVTGSGPLLPGLDVTTRTSLSVTNQQPCRRGRDTVTCAVFEMRTVFDREALAALVARLEQGSPIAMAPAVRPLELETVLRVTMETGTMLPHEALLTRTSRMQEDVNGQPLARRDFESRRSVFVYDDATTEAPASQPSR
jgi:hypothetical protein